jgi:hypothetical protein
MSCLSSALLLPQLAPSLSSLLPQLHSSHLKYSRKEPTQSTHWAVAQTPPRTTNRHHEPCVTHQSLARRAMCNTTTSRAARDPVHHHSFSNTSFDNDTLDPKLTTTHPSLICTIANKPSCSTTQPAQTTHLANTAATSQTRLRHHTARQPPKTLYNPRGWCRPSSILRGTTRNLHTIDTTGRDARIRRSAMCILRRDDISISSRVEKERGFRRGRYL